MTIPSRGRSTAEGLIEFDVWGCRGSRSFIPPRSRIGNNTSCYSIFDGSDLLVFDAGRGVAALGSALLSHPRFARVRRIHILVTHAHMDHWEGLKDADWFWARGNRLELTILGRPEAVETIQRAFDHPAYVPLDRLACGTLEKFAEAAIELRDPVEIGSWKVEAFPLNHYSGMGESRRFLDTAGFRVSSPRGAVVSYLSDHEPTAKTKRVEHEMTKDASMAIFDASYRAIRDHAFGHGSLEYAASVAKEKPDTMILAAHHGPSQTDAEIRAAQLHWGRGLENYQLAVEGRTYRWNDSTGSFARRRSRDRS